MCSSDLSILLKLEDVLGVEKLTEEQRAKYARPTELARKYRGEDLPVLTAYKSQTGAPVAEKYTPAQVARIRKDIVEIEKRLAADKAKSKVKGIKPVARSAKEIARDKRRLARLKEDVENAQFYRGTAGMKPTKIERLESNLETMRNQAEIAPTAALNRRISNAEARLRKLQKEATFMSTPKIEAKGEKTSPAKRGEEALFDVMDVIDQLRKGEFFGGAAGKIGRAPRLNSSH